MMANKVVGKDTVDRQLTSDTASRSTARNEPVQEASDPRMIRDTEQGSAQLTTPFGSAAGLTSVLSGMRRVESGSSTGNYEVVGRREAGGTPRGAYGILDTNWGNWSSQAGIPGASFRSKGAQDRVAAFMMQRFFDRYKSWELAVAAWFGGTDSADIIAKRGGMITNAKIARFVGDVTKYMTTPDDEDINTIDVTAAQRAAQRENTGGWVFPVAGANQWSQGSYMAKHTKGDRSHYAIDIYADKGTPIVVPVAGTIRSMGQGELGGTWVQVQGNDGVTYYFAHMDKRAAGLEKGQKVGAGHFIGTVGNTGSARGTSSHAHFTMKVNGQPINPTKYLNGAQTSDGLFDLTAVEATADQVSAMQATDEQVSAGFGQSTGIKFGSSLPERFVETAANSVASVITGTNTRNDPRKWIDPDVRELDLTEDDEPVEVA